ncbi:nucleotidyltransferase-like protein [Virgibacillus ndiopensis]|uniref:nucleotidyltransferase-like protein n=1 Tax=Virgibacillus ndiopensis TaxID=2004408 RepID=UPI000C0890B4|nr:nucleotidyltransferase-like protein [Virgibacillus ndiopensis]
MEDLLRPIYQERASDANTLGVLLIEKMRPNSPITDNFDVILLIIVEKSDISWHVKHYEFDDKIAAMHIVTNDLLRKWIDTSGYRKAIAWLTYGKVIFDRNEYIANFKEQIRDFPHDKRNLRKAIEFGKLVKSYSEVKDLYESSQYKDAYSRIVNSLHYLARLAVIEKGYHPEVTVWNQVRQIDPEVYKLYDELIQSDEEIDKRVKLMILATDFVISNRAKVSAKHLLDVLKERDGSWSYSELKDHPTVKPYALDLTAMLAYLVEKSIVQTERVETKGVGVYQRKYRVEA